MRLHHPQTSLPPQLSASGAVPTPGALWAGRYRLETCVATGGQGAVYRARDETLGRAVAIKFLRCDHDSDPEAVSRFAREAQALARLRHPNIVAVHDFDVHQGRPYLVTDWLTGQTLDALARQAPMPPQQAAALVAEIADAVDAIHRAGLLHRDLKLSNIHMEPDGRPVVMDFGLARFVQQPGGQEPYPTRGEDSPSEEFQRVRTSLTVEGAMLGTPGFAAPEQAIGTTAAVDVRSDVYSLGVILYALLAGRLPFQGPPLSMIRAAAERDPPAPGVYRRGIPAHAQAICLQALARQRSRRWPTAGALAAALRAGQSSPAWRRVVARDLATHRMAELVGQLSAWSAAAVITTAALLLMILWPGPSQSQAPPAAFETHRPDDDRRLPTALAVPAPRLAADWHRLPRRAGQVAEPEEYLAALPGETPLQRLTEETLRIGAGRFTVTIRLAGPRQAFLASPAPTPSTQLRGDPTPPSPAWIVGDLTLRAAETHTVVETFPLAWAMTDQGWYCDPLSYMAAAAGPFSALLTPDLRAGFVDTWLAQVRSVQRLAATTATGPAPARAALLLIPRPRGRTTNVGELGLVSAESVRAWLRHPTLTGHPIPPRQPQSPAEAADFPRAEPPHGALTTGLVDLNALEPMIAGWAECVTDLAQTAWVGGDPASRPVAVLLLVALANPSGTMTDLGPPTRQRVSRLLRIWLLALFGEAPPPAPLVWQALLVPPSREGRLYRALDPGVPLDAAGRPDPETTALWADFAHRLRAIAAQWRSSHPEAADALEHWLAACWAGPPPVRRD